MTVGLKRMGEVVMMWGAARGRCCSLPVAQSCLPWGQRPLHRHRYRRRSRCMRRWHPRLSLCMSRTTMTILIITTPCRPRHWPPLPLPQRALGPVLPRLLRLSAPLGLVVLQTPSPTPALSPTPNPPPAPPAPPHPAAPTSTPRPPHHTHRTSCPPLPAAPFYSTQWSHGMKTPTAPFMAMAAAWPPRWLCHPWSRLVRTQRRRPMQRTRRAQRRPLSTPRAARGGASLSGLSRCGSRRLVRPAHRTLTSLH